ncbi:hypothetical protein OXX69_007249 [Metschnikowia pulcherrima]
MSSPDERMPEIDARESMETATEPQLSGQEGLPADQERSESRGIREQYPEIDKLIQDAIRNIPREEKLKNASEVLGFEVTDDFIKRVKAEGAKTSVHLIGDSGYNAGNVHKVLKQVKHDSKVKDATQQTLDSFQARVSEKARSIFEGAKPLTEATAYKWCEKIENFLDDYKGSMEVLTTKDYAEAKFGKSKVTWGRYKFQGGHNLRNAFAILDSTMTDYVWEAKLLECLQHKSKKLNVRDIWMKAQLMAQTGVTEPYEKYFEETYKFWSYIEFDDPQVAFERYLFHMKEMFDEVLVNFMESLGFPAYIAWIWWRKTEIGPTYLKAIEECQSEFRKTKAKNREWTGGVDKLTVKLTESRLWQEGRIEKIPLTKNELNWRRKRQGDSEVQVPYSKRSNISKFGGIRNFGSTNNNSMQNRDRPNPQTGQPPQPPKGPSGARPSTGDN